MSRNSADALPLPDYDELPIGSIEHRIRSLDGDEVRELMRYEDEHAGRPAAHAVLAARLDQLAAGAEPSGGDPDAVHPEHGHHAAGSPVTPASSPEPRHSPPHGTPDQPGRPKGNRP